MNKETEEKQEILLEQWKTCVEMANSISQRRDVMNNLFVTINVALLTTIIVISSDSFNACFFRLIISIGIVLCIAWILLLVNYRKLNSAKYKVINMIEEKLPLQPFKIEWEMLKQKKCFIQQTIIEIIIPCVFIVFFITLCAIK